LQLLAANELEILFAADSGVVEADKLLTVAGRTGELLSNRVLRNRVTNSQNIRAAVERSSAIYSAVYKLKKSIVSAKMAATLV
jgi:hypothetical protein